MKGHRIILFQFVLQLGFVASTQISTNVAELRPSSNTKLTKTSKQSSEVNFAETMHQDFVHRTHAPSSLEHLYTIRRRAKPPAIPS